MGVEAKHRKAVDGEFKAKNEQNPYQKAKQPTERL
jgi:hypothetical protein